jgi:hypothetical protein
MLCVLKLTLVVSIVQVFGSYALGQCLALEGLLESQLGHNLKFCQVTTTCRSWKKTWLRLHPQQQVLIARTHIPVHAKRIFNTLPGGGF